MSAPRLPRNVWRLGWVSLATDAASEAIYPLLPFFLTQVLGAGAISLGIVEGAEAVNSLLKTLSGRWADRARAKRPIVLGGYALSSAIRPLMSLAQSWTHVFGIRFVDRVGKGIRGAPRDALLATLATPETRGRVYGFHRGMDHAGRSVRAAHVGGASCRQGRGVVRRRRMVRSCGTPRRDWAWLEHLCARLRGVRVQCVVDRAACLVSSIRTVLWLCRGHREGAGGRPRAGVGTRIRVLACTPQVQGLGSFAASLLFGGLWSFFGPVAAFATGAALAVAATAALFVMVPDSRHL